MLHEDPGQGRSRRWGEAALRQRHRKPGDVSRKAILICSPSSYPPACTRHTRPRAGSPSQTPRRLPGAALRAMGILGRGCLRS